MLPTLMRRMAQAAKTQITTQATPSKLKKVWPPDFSKLSPQEQLRFEKRYKRRLRHIAQRPTWTKMVKLAQYFTISFVLVYSVLFMDWRNEKQPFDDVRRAVWGFFGLEYHPYPKPEEKKPEEKKPESRNRSETWK
ncbi:hypothetical protein QBC47DRAFT_383863 [Echria macrotheca]|uniref:Uncharacterized protein n=1 Tax=Echria macrotheca TaxID=438768 RepID=A0AAJ0B9Y7_9PEZI|nr:hypothetical protein QBC47DRAFT_383863 [Echria macrotheca]